MSKKAVIVMTLVSFLALGVVTLEAYARHDDGKTKAHKMSFEDKFSMKIHSIFKNKDELGISDNQLEKLKDLKINTKKDLIKKDAEIDILALDIKSEMYGDSIDTVAVNKLIDKKYEIKKEKAKSLVGACAALRNILTKDQKKKMKDLQKKCDKEKVKRSMMGGDR